MATKTKKIKAKSTPAKSNIHTDFTITGDIFDEMLSTASINDEVELSFMRKLSRISMEKYITLLKYFSVANFTVETKDTLNVSFNYNYDYLSSYRITIEGLETINSTLGRIMNRDNHIIFLMLIKQIKDGNKHITIMNKQKTKDNIVDIEKLGIRLRKSKELDIEDDKIDFILPLASDKSHINFRYIQRASLIIEQNEDYVVRVDLSYVQMSDNIKTIAQKVPSIELEIDFTLLKDLTAKTKQKVGQTIDSTYRNLLRVLQKSNIIMNPEDQGSVIKKLHKLLFPEKVIELRDLPTMNPESAELQHIVDYINQDYCVTDKADGERYFMVICDTKVYLISKSNEVKEIESPDGAEVFNDSIFDGEYLYNEEYGKFMFLAFDCLMFKGEDKRQDKILQNRLDCVKTMTKELYGQRHTFAKYSGKFDYDKMEKYYTENMSEHMHELVTRLESNEINVISVKYFAFPQGIKSWEIFFLTSLMLKIYTTPITINKRTIMCPYSTDGCMWTPNEHTYERSSSLVKKKIYKYKPTKFNSLDCYCEFARDPVTKDIIDVFDNADANMQYIDMNDEEFTNKFENEDSADIKVKDQVYRIMYLHVGKSKGNAEYPVLFQEEHDHHFAYVYLTDGEARDQEGNILQDKTVIEWAYKNDHSVKAGSRWIPLRTRHDKTESVRTLKRKYGNNSAIADKTWKSMIDGIEVTDINLLGHPDTYDAHHAKLKSHITSSMIESERRDGGYYTLVSNIERPLKDFHGWVKQNLILTYCGKKDTNMGVESLDVLDYGIGRGGDLNKYLHARVNSLTGFDIDSFGIYSGSDSATSRYQTLKKKMGVIGFSMKFLVCDGGAKLTLKDQHNAGIESTEVNDKSMLQIFDNDHPKLYDAISVQFVAHYFFKNDQTVANFMDNLVRFTKPSGYVIITTFDGDTVHKDLVKDGGQSTTHYVNKEGTKYVLYDIIKRYEGDIQNITGQGIDVHLPVFDEDTYRLEYLVPKKLLIDKMSENGFSLVETDMLWNMHTKNKQFFKNAVEFESGKTRNYYMSVKEYYNESDPLNQILYPHTKKNRFYVFQKNDDGEFKHTKSMGASYASNTGSKKFDKSKKSSGFQGKKSNKSKKFSKK
jgi:SAM-dependent methyltransferase